MYAAIFNPTSPRQLDAGLAILRVVTGVIFIAHGWQKLFSFGLAGVTQGFAGMGIPFAGIAAPAVAFVELFGGIALVLGLLTRPAGLGLAITMFGAMMFVHIQSGFFAPQGIEFVLALMGAALTLMVTGAGSWSVDALIASRREAAAPATSAQYSAPRRAA
jgi:putative oxidoreductase